jgi:hypothetical protein
MSEDACTKAIDQARSFSSSLSLVLCVVNLAELILEVL